MYKYLGEIKFCSDDRSIIEILVAENIVEEENRKEVL